MSRAPAPDRLRDALADARGAILRPAVVGVLVALLTWALGSHPVPAFVVGLAVAAAVAVLQRLDARVEPRAARGTAQRSDGARGEIAETAWTMQSRDGRAGERALRRLREAGARRLARHGLDLSDPADADAVLALIGARARTTLTQVQHPRPSVADLAHTLKVLEDLGAQRAPAPGVSAPGTDPHPPAARSRR